MGERWGISAMSCVVVTSSAARIRIRRAEAWLESRKPDEELLVIGATLDAANELARQVAKKKGAAFGWHRLTLPQLAFAIAAPVLAARGLTPLSRIGADAIVARIVHRMNADGRLSHYRSVLGAPGFPRPSPE
jgi:ATP-dependent helicase/nuclease subunit B